MDYTKVKSLLTDWGCPTYRLQQVFESIYHNGVQHFREISVLPKELRARLENELSILSFTVEKVLRSKDKKTIKALIRLHDDKTIETVLIQTKPRMWSACISSQAGCVMACTFCATGAAGFKRNLTTEEITDQVLFWRQYKKEKKIQGTFSNVIYMGMGEPFANWVHVRQSLKDFTDPELFGFGSRCLSVSTSGMAKGIVALATEFPQVNLALSLHFADDEKRTAFMPINKATNLEGLKNALQEYFVKTKRKVFIEYIMLKDKNDSRQDAINLAHYLKEVHPYLLHVNLIPYNTTTPLLQSSSSSTIRAFRDILKEQHISATIRKTMGQDIDGACGQLAGKLPITNS